MTKNVSVFIDLANMNCAFSYLQKAHNLSPHMRIDWVTLVSLLAQHNTVTTAAMYIGIPPHVDILRHGRFVHHFTQHGFIVKTKDCKIIRLDDGTTKWKANFDVEITWDIAHLIRTQTCDEIMLCSGDSDFAYLIDNLRKLHIATTVVSSVDTISKELESGADRVILLDHIDPHTYTYTKK